MAVDEKMGQSGSMKKIVPTIEFLRECFECSAAEGVLKWRKRPRNHFGHFARSAA